MSKYEFNDILSTVLRLGVVVSIILLATGVTLIFVMHGADGYTIDQIASYGSGSGTSSFSINSSSLPLTGILNGVVHLNGLYFISLGLWVLIFTPISIVLIALAEFAYLKNRLYVVLSVIVLFDLFFAMLVVPVFFHV